MRRLLRWLLLAPAMGSVSVPAQDIGTAVGGCPPAERTVWQEAVQRDLVASWHNPRPDELVSCIVVVVQNFRGEVLHAGVEGCDVDEVVVRSLEDAAYEASPLPRPDSRACFEREVRVLLVSNPRGED